MKTRSGTFTVGHTGEPGRGFASRSTSYIIKFNNMQLAKPIYRKEKQMDEELTLEQLRELVEKQTQTINELTAERDSLKQEADVSRETLETTKKELHDTKAMNYTLARQLDVGKEEESPENILYNLYGKRRN